MEQNLIDKLMWGEGECKLNNLKDGAILCGGETYLTSAVILTLDTSPQVRDRSASRSSGSAVTYGCGAGGERGSRKFA